jgi:Ca2+-binding RTX toxin-like protein
MAFQYGTHADDVITGTSSVDVIFAGRGDDRITAGDDSDVVFAGKGNDTIFGGNGNDALFGDAGDDLVIGNKGDDLMVGGRGNDTLGWADGDGSDRMVGGRGYDTVSIIGSDLKDELFTLQQQGDKAIFDRTNLGPFTLTVTSSEVFSVQALAGDDQFTVGNLDHTAVKLVKFLAGDGSDRLDASATYTPLFADGGNGSDSLVGGYGDDTLTGGNGIDTITGGAGYDRILFTGGAFANGTPVATPNGIKALNTPDIITDFNLHQDQLAIKGSDFGLNQLVLGQNLVVLQTPVANAAAAAKAIADDASITADQGAFIYFNTTLGFARLVFSNDLGDGGDISVLANLVNQTNPAVLTQINPQTVVLV